MNLLELEMYKFFIVNYSINIKDEETCGNGIKEGKEICDDGNVNPFDGCFNCEFSCVLGCSHCI